MTQLMHSMADTKDGRLRPLTHSRFWEGIDALIYGDKSAPLAELRLALQTSVPSISEFQKFEEAFDHAKGLRSVGLVFIVDPIGETLPLGGVLSQLGRPFESRGWPCFGVLIRSDREIPPDDWAAMHTSGKLLFVIEAHELLDSERREHTLSRLRHAYLKALAELLMPGALHESLLAFSYPELSRESALFRERLCYLLSGVNEATDLTVLETLSVLWSPLLETIEAKAPSLLAPHPALRDLRSLTHPPAPGIMPPAARVHALTASLDGHRLDGTLDRAMRDLAAGSVQDGDPLDERLHACADRILDLAREIEEASTLPEAA